MSTIVIYTSGTLGDHLPFIALGQALTARGHRIRMAINQAMHDYAHRMGLETLALTDIERGPEQARENAWAWDHWRTPDLAAHPNAEPFDVERYIAQARELIDLCRGADLLISTSIRTLGYVVYSDLRLPWLTVSVNPFLFWQPASAEEREVVRANRLKEYNVLKDLIAYAFAGLGIDRTPPPWSPGWLFARHVILASSPHFSRPDLNQLQPHSSIDMTGFWFYQDPAWQDWQPDQALRNFCQRRPIVLSFSSQPLENPRRALAVHVEAAARLNQPLLVQRGWAGFSPVDLPSGVDPENIMFADFMPHDWLFAQAACAIQHGGIGSIARALRQSCPLLIEPYGNDQLYNASRVVGLGVGATMHPFKMTVDGLVRVLSEKVMSPNCRQRAEEVGARIRAENGLEVACHLIGAYLAQQRSGDRSTWQIPYIAVRKERAIAFPQRPPLDGYQTGMPRLLHQTWKDTNVPPALAMFQRTWQTHHPNWTYHLWTDADNREFLRRHHPWFLPIYDNYPEHIMRVDAVRYFILHHYGGVYVDLDFECLRPLEPLLTGKEAVFGLEPSAHLDFHFPKVRALAQIVSNAFMASVPGHPFWEHVFKQLIAYHRAPDPLNATGPFLLTRAYESFPHKEGISIEPADLLSPISNAESQNRVYEDPTVRERIVQTAYAVHHWHCTWWKETRATRAEQVPISILLNGQPNETTSLLQLEEYREQLEHAPELPRVSCLMITEDRADLAQRSVHCFQQQTYPNRELVIVDSGGDDSLEQWVEQLNDDRIIYARLPALDKPLGELWNLAVEKATGAYVARWDDDDLSDPRRLEVQLAAIQVLQTDACFLQRQQLWWPEKLGLSLSSRRIWESSLVCAKAKLSLYPAECRTDNAAGIDQVVAEGRTAVVDFPQLYTHVFREGNPSKAKHWEEYWQTATESYDGEIYNILIQQLQNGLNLDLSSWIDREPTDASPARSTSGPALAERQLTIPRIVHQTWKDTNVPPALAMFQRTWQTHHSDWTHYLWTDVDNREFLRRHYPWFLPIYDNYPEHIMRVDAVRYFILHHYGGVYVDLDFECLRPLEPLLTGKEVVFGLEPPAHLDLHFPRERGLDQIVSNAFMASAPGHLFWEHVFKQLTAYHQAPGPLDATGPFLLTRAYESFPHKETIRIEPARLLFPVSSEKPWHELAPEVQAQVAQTAYAIHHWRGSWWRPTATRQAQQIKTSLLVRGEVVNVSTMMMNQCLALSQKISDLPLISCLLVTKNRADLAQRSVLCFQQQTYPNKELVIVDDGEEDWLEQWVDRVDDERITYVRLPAESKSLGELRNIAVERATGEYVAQWDDDDLSDPRRLEIQLAAIRVLQTEACFLERHQIWWPDSRRLALSCRRIWESSFVCAKAKLPPYPALLQGEDTPVTGQLVAEERVAVLDLPQLYTYVFHGANTFAAHHWEAHWLAATESYEGDMYDIMIQELQNRLELDLLPWIGQKPAASAPACGGEASQDSTVLITDEGPSSPQEGQLLARSPSIAGLQTETAGAPPSGTTLPKVLILTPVKDAVRFLPGYWEKLKALTYPHDRISVAFLESDSIDGTYTFIEENLPALQAEFAKAKLFKRDFAYRAALPRWEPSEQFKRRSIMAKSHNHLLAQALEDEDWVLWIDVDVARWPNDVVEQLLATNKDIVVPNCLSEHTGETFDYNTFKLKPEAKNLDWSPYIVDDILQPPKGYGRLYLSDLRQYDCVEVDAVGGTMLLIRADIHREGLVFPTFSYKFHIETEGLALMAKDMGYRCWGLPNLEIFHP